ASAPRRTAQARGRCRRCRRCRESTGSRRESGARGAFSACPGPLPLIVPLPLRRRLVVRWGPDGRGPRRPLCGFLLSGFGGDRNLSDVLSAPVRSRKANGEYPVLTRSSCLVDVDSRRDGNPAHEGTGSTRRHPPLLVPFLGLPADDQHVVVALDLHVLGI